MRQDSTAPISRPDYREFGRGFEAVPHHLALCPRPPPLPPSPIILCSGSSKSQAARCQGFHQLPSGSFQPVGLKPLPCLQSPPYIQSPGVPLPWNTPDPQKGRFPPPQCDFCWSGPLLLQLHLSPCPQCWPNRRAEPGAPGDTGHKESRQ